MQEITLEERIKEIRQEILTYDYDARQYGIIEVEHYEEPQNAKVFGPLTENYSSMIGSVHEFELSIKYGVPFKELWRAERWPGRYGSGYRARITGGDREDKKEIKKIIEERKRMREKVKNYPIRYQREGQIVINGMAIPMTQKELIESGLDPKMFGWKSLEEVKRAEKKEQAVVTAKDIADATKELPRRAIEGVRSLFSREKDDKSKGRGE